MKTLYNPIFILGCHKSGTSLLKSLLDGHPELIALPSETHFFQYSGHWVDYELRNNINIKLSPEEQKKGLLQFFKYENKIIDPYAPSNMNGKYDQSLFMESMDLSTYATTSQLFSSYINAIHYSLTKNNIPESKRIVEKSVENSAFSPLLKSWFPNSKFIHIVRNPYATITAIRKMKSANGFPFLGPLIRSLQNSYYDIYRNKSTVNDYLVIRYEDLITNPKVIMHNIAQHLGINFDECLMHPTLQGKQWTGNSTSNQSISDISSTPLNYWEKDITDLEITLINRYLEPILYLYDYKMKHSRHKYNWLPEKKEGIKNYYRNRALIISSSRSLF